MELLTQQKVQQLKWHEKEIITADMFTDNNITAIGDNAFARIRKKYYVSNSILKSIDIPSSVVSIGDNAFRECQELQNITLHTGLKKIGENAFCGCQKLTSLYIPDNVEMPIYQTFNMCISLKTLHLPYGLKHICSNMFAYCKSLRKIVLPITVNKIDSDILGAYSCDCTHKDIYVYNENVYRNLKGIYSEYDVSIYRYFTIDENGELIKI